MMTLKCNNIVIACVTLAASYRIFPQTANALLSTAPRKSSILLENQRYHFRLSDNRSTLSRVKSRSIPPSSELFGIDSSKQSQTETHTIFGGNPQSRREHLSKVLVLATIASGFSPFPSRAADEQPTSSTSDLTTRLFNPDGSLKENTGVTGVATFQTTSKTFPSGEKVTYQTPTKWNENYIDTSINKQICTRISVFSTPGSVGDLKKAAQTGIAKALKMDSVEGYNPNILKADLVNGKKTFKNDLEYYDYDLAVAPETCVSGGVKEDLGLGFCPYDSVVLLAATAVEDTIYVCQVECTRDQWRLANAELKQVRESFMVEQPQT